MRRALAASLVALVGLLFGWLAALTPESVTNALAQDVHTHTHTHNHRQSDAASTSTSTERAPPAPSKQAIGYSAVDRWSNGSLARAGPVATPTTSTHDDSSRLLQAALSTG